MGEIATQLNRVPHNDPALAPYFSLAAEWDIPLLIHVEESVPTRRVFGRRLATRFWSKPCSYRIQTPAFHVENTGYPSEMISMMYQHRSISSEALKK